ncbi:bifunctional 3-demethylubiquinone 3-O-methyltransferase/2-octaprenyl-6-hydroxy phenol methylase [Luedemannella flava]|uniref:Bifunctional 3-demethylubiquinone 3-O-methyltransferase/2-octaprenyl-6-hydroxy phenol methylase n=1 Tax=Luedemannella flava TaxID=349316 RepID=A0ABP4YL82_9ACTN
MPRALLRNDVRQYEDLRDEWWRPNGKFVTLHWIAAARAALLPPAPHDRAVLVDLACGAGLMAPHAARLGYRHVGVDLVTPSLEQAREHGVAPIRADVTQVPLADGCADAVTAGEILEHVPDPAAVVAEACRLLRPGGTLVVDTINATARARLVVVTIGERVPGGAPPGIHDPRLFVRPSVIVEAAARHGVRLTVTGFRPSARQMLRWMITRRGTVRMVPSRSTAVLYQAVGTKSET